ncbi:MAG: cytochrome c3 family protein [Pseudomonadota bacterium]
MSTIKTYLLFISLILTVIVPFNIPLSWAGSYTLSAHGSSSYGVNRISLSPYGYAMGNCAHCHEQHALFGGVEVDPTGSPDKWLVYDTLYTDQDTTFCQKCHCGTASSKQQSMPEQCSYSYKFGGDGSLSCPDNIRRAFRFITESGVPQLICDSPTGSAHQLTYIRTFLKGKWGFGNTNDKVNPCSGCHNPHKAQRHNYPVGGTGTSPLSLPTTHDGDWNVYGAQTTERMDSHTYQAPYYSGSTTTYEPDGNSTSDGSNMPDYVAFCTACHNTGYNGGQMTSSQKSQFTTGVPAWIQNPDWTASPHGNTDGMKADSMKRKAPYTANRNYVLSCTDCHETHGSPNRMLVRKEVNGESAVTFTDWDSRSDWLTLCQRCHTITSSHKMDTPCRVCHTHDPNWMKPF